MLACPANMGDWKNEDDIKAELRVLTAELRRLREGLRDMVSPKKPSPSRAFLNRQSWPASADPAQGESTDRPRQRRKTGQIPKKRR
jgi:hypothetical protein